MNRRHFLAQSSLVTSTVGLTAASIGAAAPALAPTKRARPAVQLAISTYSYWHFRGPKVPVETVIEKAAGLGVAGVDFLHRQMDLPEKEPLTGAHRAYLNRLKRQMFAAGLAPVCLSTHQGFVSPDPAVVASNVDPAESDLSAVDPKEVVAAATGSVGTAESARADVPLTPAAEFFAHCLTSVSR